MSIARARVQQCRHKKTEENDSGKKYKLCNNDSAIFHGFMACSSPIGKTIFFSMIFNLMQIGSH